MNDRGHFEALDALRGVAAGLVLVGHASAVMLDPARTFVPRKDLAVVFFFMLSGFVVSSAYQRRIAAGLPFGQFMLRRAIRLFPMIVLATAIASVIDSVIDPTYWAGARGPLASLLSAACLPDVIRPYTPGTRFPIDPPEWSLFYELVAYLLFATVLARGSTKALGVLAVLTFAADMAGRLAFPPNQGPPGMQLFEAVPAFSAGMLLWRWFERGVAAPPVSLPLLGGVLCAASLVPASWGVLPDALAAALAFPLVLSSGAARGRGHATAAERVLGDISYPLYIVHWPVLILAHRTVQPRFGAAVAMVVGVAVAIITAWAATRFVDQPVRRWLVGRLVPSSALAVEARAVS